MSNNVGTPDWQRGIVSPQLLVDSFAAGTSGGTVNIPPNTETLLVIGVDEPITDVIGTTTGSTYPAILLQENNRTFWVITVSPAADPAVQITLQSATLAKWYVVADAGVRVVANDVLSAVGLYTGQVLAANQAGLLVAGQYPTAAGLEAAILEVDANGRLVPLVPTAAVNVTTTTASAIAAPASGAWYLFGADLTVTAGTPVSVELVGHTSGLYLGVLQSNAVDYDADHVNLDGMRVAEAVDITYVTGAATGRTVVRYAPGP